MKRIGILIACLLALACCAPAPAETVPAAGEGAAADPWEIPTDNPIDAAIPVPRADGDNGPELLAARLRLADAWRGEMVHAYRTLRELLPDDRAGALMEAQYGFEAYLPGAVEVYAAAYDPQREPGESAAAAGYEAELCRRRVAELARAGPTADGCALRVSLPRDGGDRFERAGPARDLYAGGLRPRPGDQRRVGPGRAGPEPQKLLLDRGGPGLSEDRRDGGRLENYLEIVLREQRDPEKGIPELTDEVVYRAAVSNAPDIYPFAFAPFLEMIPGGSTRFSKERITQTAKLLFGWECEINFENLGDTGRYPFHPYFGVATLEGGLVKTGATPVVTAYEAGEGFYEADVVFLHWDTMGAADYVYNDGEKLVEMTEEEAREACRGLLPGYRVRVKREPYDGNLRNERLYFVSLLGKDA